MSAPHAGTKRRGRRRRRHKPPVGSTPGALAPREGEPPPKLAAMWYDLALQGERALGGPAEIRALLADATLTTWIDIEGLGNLDVLREIGAPLDLHPLALADIVNVPQRPKVEMYGDRLLFIGHMAFLNPAGDVELEQVSLVLGPHWVVSFQDKPGDVFEPLRGRIRSPQMRIRRMRADFLAYALVDAIVDGYFTVIEKIGNDLDVLEDEVMDKPTHATLERIHGVRRHLQHDRVVLLAQQRQGLLSAPSRRDLMTSVLEHIMDELPHFYIVIHNKNCTPLFSHAALLIRVIWSVWSILSVRSVSCV